MIRLEDGQAIEVMPRNAQRVLVIKHGALGDFIQAMAPAKMIRSHHVGARITLLTEEPLAKFAETSPFYDVVEIDNRSKDPKHVAEVIGRIRRARYDCIYDLQTSERTGRYFTFLRPKPPLWSGIAPGCSHPHANPLRTEMHSLDRLADQMRFAGLGPAGGYPPGEAPIPDLSWIRRALRDPPRLQPEYFGVKPPYILIIPGASPHREAKRWPAEHYARLAKEVAKRGVTPVLIGRDDVKEAATAILKEEPRAKNLISRTDLFQIAALAERAAAAVGNDTGPMHIAAAAGASCVVLFSAESDPAKVCPRGPKSVLALRAEKLSDMPVDQVLMCLRNVGALPAVASSA